MVEIIKNQQWCKFSSTIRMICNGSENDNVKITVKIKINCVSLRVEIIYPHWKLCVKLSVDIIYNTLVK
jgi:hypothetical protein